MKRKSLIFAFFLILTLLILPDSASAQLLPPCTATGNCGLCDIIDTGVKIFRWLLGLLGGSALFLFVWHGFGWLTSGGNKENIEKSKKGLIHTVIGILLVLGSWFLVNLILTLLLTPVGDTAVQKLFSTDSKEWYKYCTGGGQCEGKGDGTPCGSITTGQFCLKGECKKHEKVLGSGDYYDDACEYFSLNAKAYEKYECKTESQCQPGKILGPKYCSNNSTPNPVTCCEPKQL